MCSRMVEICFLFDIFEEINNPFYKVILKKKTILNSVLFCWADFGQKNIPISEKVSKTW